MNNKKDKLLNSKIWCLLIISLILGGVVVPYLGDYFKHPSFKFVGESPHFIMKKGVADFNGKKKELEISNFSLKENIDGIISYKVSLYFKDELWGSFEQKNITKDVNELLNEELFVQKDGVCSADFCDKNEFLKSKRYNFKNRIKIVITFETKDAAITEEMKLKYA